MARKARGRPGPPETAIYVIEITGWDWWYSIGKGRLELDETAIAEVRNIVIKGVPRGPKLGRANQAQVSLQPGWKLEDLRLSEDGSETLLGSIWMNAGRFDVSQRITEEAASAILQMLIADKVRFVRIEATPMQRREASVLKLFLLMDLAEDEDVGS